MHVTGGYDLVSQGKWGEPLLGVSSESWKALKL